MIPGTTKLHRLDCKDEVWVKRWERAVGSQIVDPILASQLARVGELDATNQVVSRFVYDTRYNVPDYTVKGGATCRLVTDHLGAYGRVAGAGYPHHRRRRGRPGEV